MKVRGIVRKVDVMGRVVIPKEFRDSLGIDPEDQVEIKATVSGEVILCPAEGIKCSGCAAKDVDLKRFGNAYLCAECIEAVRKMTEGLS